MFHSKDSCSKPGLVIRIALIVLLALVVSCDLVVAGGVRSAGLASEDAPRGPEATCAAACRARASRCTRHQCARGCNLVLDRLVEHEGEHVIACVGRATSSCDDATWADCATRIGVYADGGPPAPPPRKEQEDEE
jgi:hypothetical protein